MLKNIIATSLVAATLILSGCGDAEGESRLAAQSAIDSGDFSAAIANLEAKPARTDSDNLTLASAYMGEAGFSFVDVISLMGSDTDPSSGSASGFEGFAKQIDDKKTPETLANIDKAIAAYSAISTVTADAPSRVQERAVATTSKGDAALFLGIAYLTKATVVMSYLGNITELGNGSSSVVNAELQASADAIKCVYTGTCGGITFSTRPDLNVDLNVSGFIRTATPGTDASTRGELVLTNYVDNVYAVDGNYTINDAIISAINGGFDAIVDFAPDEVKDDIRDYRNEIIYSDLIIGNDDVNNHNIVDYNSTHLSFDGGNIRSNDIDEAQIASFLEK